MRVDVLDTIVDVVKGNNGEYGAKNFVGKQRRVALHICYESGSNVALVAVCCATKQDSAMREQGQQAVEVTKIDNARIVGAVQWVVAILLFDNLLHECNEPILDTIVYKEVVGSNTCLPAVEEFTPNDAFGSHAQIGIAIDDTRTLATEFECYGCEELRGSL